MQRPSFLDRQDAGRKLVPLLMDYAQQEDTIVLALPRGGIPVACEIALALELPMDVFLVRKLGISWHPELAMGAVASGGVYIRNDDVMLSYHISEDMFNQVLKKEEKELIRREKLYHPHPESPDLEDKTILLVDDGMATGTTMQVAIIALKEHYHPAAVIVAVPVLSTSAYDTVAGEVNDVVYLLKPVDFRAVGEWYEDFTQVSDSEAQGLIQNFLRTG